MQLQTRVWRFCPSIYFDFTPVWQCLDVDAATNAQYKAFKQKLTEHGWTGRQELHKQIVDATVRNLSAKYDIRLYGYVQNRARVLLICVRAQRPARA